MYIRVFEKKDQNKESWYYHIEAETRSEAINKAKEIVKEEKEYTGNVDDYIYSEFPA